MIVKATESIGRCRVACDGVDLTHVSFEADSKAGVVKCYEWDGYPAPPVAPVKLKQPVSRIEVRGKVSIEMILDDVP